MAQKRIKHKVGDTFAPSLFRPDPYGSAGEGYDLTNTVITSQVRVGSKVFELEAFALDQSQFRGRFHIEGDTSLWPADEELEWDVQFDDEGVVQSTETVLILTIPDITKK